MIAPNMATMLGYIFTDANVSSDVLQKILADIVEKSFNSITVDSDQSTNDTVLAFATATAKHNFIDNAENKSIANFKITMEELAIELAKMIVIDGEGAKKLIEINVINATNYQQAKIVAMAIANSPLVKSAMAASDPNWGRIIMAIGKSTTNISPQQIKVKIGDFLIAENGSRVNDYNEANVHQYLKREEVKIIVDLGINKTQEIKNTSASQTMKQDLYSTTVWGCDLNEEYVKINKDYRS
jgi:glutamate N-acetyltransferase/amino-acid N-acetyltransferase